MVVLSQKRHIHREMFGATSVMGGRMVGIGFKVSENLCVTVVVQVSPVNTFLPNESVKSHKDSYLPNLMYEYAFPGCYSKRKG